jgi:hypothetical protein
LRVCFQALSAGCGTKTTTVTVRRVTTVVDRIAAPADAILIPRRDGELVYRPSTIALSDTVALTDIRWSSFGKRRAVGRGTYYLNVCEPTCATAPATRWLLRLLSLGGCHAVATSPT